MKPIIKKGYKVVNISKQSLCQRTDWVQYSDKEWAKRKEDCGPLAVFNNKNVALRFADFLGGYVYVCEYTPSKDKDLWHCTGKGTHGLAGSFLSASTRLADSVRLIGKAL